MTEAYPFLGGLQPKNLSKTVYQNFGSHPPMEPADSEAFGRRVKQRRDDLGMSQDDLADATGYSQQRIGSLEKGQVKNPDRNALALAKALQTTPEWLLYKHGPKIVGKTYLTPKQVAERYQALSETQKVALSEYLENNGFPRKRPKTG